MDALRNSCTGGAKLQFPVVGMSRRTPCRALLLTSLTLTSLTLTSLTLTGCRGHVDLLEARLRAQEDLLTRTQADLSQVQSELAASQGLAERLQRQLAETTRGKLLPEQAQALFQIEGLRIDGRLTAIMTQPDSQHPATLNVVMFPHDADQQPVKAPGTLELQLFAADQQPGAQPIAEWVFDVAEVRNHWHRGPIGQGFQFQLPCEPAVTAGQLLLRARFETIDGRSYADSKTIAGRPAAQNANDFDAADRADFEG